MSRDRNNQQKTELSACIGDEAARSHFASFLGTMAAERNAWAQKEGISCYRIYDADVLPYTVAIDMYKGADKFKGQTYLVIAEYRGAGIVAEDEEKQYFTDAVKIASQELGIPKDHIFEKSRHYDRSGSHYKDGQRDSCVMYTQEAGYLFEVDLGGHLDTGIFLDHRPARELIGHMSQGGRFLNLFAYTGTATVHAAGAGAATTTTVDLSQTYLNWTQRNMELNKLEGSQHRFVRSDAMHWLDRDIRKGVTYDLVFVDPPTFSRSKLKGKKTWNVARDHVELLKKVKAVLAKGGKAIFSCNQRNFKPDLRALAQEGIELKDITEQSIPVDFAQNPEVHKCYLMSEK